MNIEDNEERATTERATTSDVLQCVEIVKIVEVMN